MWFRSLCHLPELICYKNDTPLQQERSEDPDDLTNAEALEKAFKVHVLQAWVHGPPQLNDLNTSNKHQSASLARADSTRALSTPARALQHCFMLFCWGDVENNPHPPSQTAAESTALQRNGILYNSQWSQSSSQNTVEHIKTTAISEESPLSEMYSLAESTVWSK